MVRCAVFFLPPVNVSMTVRTSSRPGCTPTHKSHHFQILLKHHQPLYYINKNSFSGPITLQKKSMPVHKKKATISVIRAAQSEWFNKLMFSHLSTPVFIWTISPQPQHCNTHTTNQPLQPRQQFRAR